MIGLCSSLAWALLGPLVLRLAAALPISGADRLGRLGAHLGIGLSLAAALTVLARVVAASGQPIAGPGAANLFTLNALIYGALLMWAHADRLIAAFRERALAAARLESELVQSRLQVESLRLHPAVLLDTLARAEALAENEPEQAERLIEQLADFLRETLDASATGRERNHSGPAVVLGS